ncbi:hypothetical protein BDA99DRAFT_532069 [Phascolomyces articulosus]|uniref:Uncharacterized protein n=1 Tax=Phascolomyces articulosus TaxID=60185 RepID=A0AAD5KB06_9FUNG|nr:hypothetical protein BDA99DRAFT_532069 [Phascolomyces articulosus]
MVIIVDSCFSFDVSCLSPLFIDTEIENEVFFLEVLMLMKADGFPCLLVPETLEYHQYVFDRQLDFTENDIAITVWGPMLEKLFRNTSLRYEEKTVRDSSDIIDSPGFKVDLRIIKDTLSRRNKEMDKVNVEFTRRNCSFSKACSDRIKMLIESKCVLNGVITGNPYLKSKSFFAPALQIVGRCMEIGATVPSRAVDAKDF